MTGTQPTTSCTGIPPTLRDSLALLPPGAPRVLFVRHADRDRARLGTWGDEIPLNAVGIERATALGRSLGPDIWALASPMERCRQTAALVAGVSGDAVATAPLLGVPGPFVVNAARAMRHFEELGTKGFVRRLLEGACLEDVRPAPAGTRLVVDLVSALLERRGGTGVCVSHDSIVAPVAGVLFGVAFTSRWIEFLEGIVFSRTATGLIAIWDGQVREVR